MKKQFFITTFLCLFVGVLSCSALQGEDQFTNKTVAPLFTSELYGSTTKSVTVSHQSDSHITWMGFIRSQDYKYFKITKVQVGTQVIVSDGVEIDGETYTANSNSVVQDLSITASEGGNNEFVDGSINVSGSNDLKITVEYSPIKAISSEDEPHEAYLIIYYDSPKVGALRVKLEGYTKGVKDEKCARDVSTMTPIVYTFKNNEFDFYTCGSEVANTNQNNIADLDPTDPDYHGEFANLTPIPTIDSNGNSQSLTFYQVDDETVCLLSKDLSGDDSSIPAFTFVIPEGLAPIDELNVKMEAGSFAECSLADGVIYCDANILIDTGVVPVAPLTLTNGEFSAEDLTTSECTDFGTLKGEGSFGDSELSLVLKGTMLSDANTQAYNIVDALVAAEIRLECESGCF